MKRHAMVILLVCIIVFFYFIRRNYFQEGKYLKEGFLDTTGEIGGSHTKIANVGAGASNICFNKVDGNFYIAVREDGGKVVRMTPSGAITNLVTPDTVITGSTKKIGTTDGNGPCGICADNDGNVYFNSQNKADELYVIPYGSTTPKLFVAADTNRKRPMGMCCGTNNIIWVVFADSKHLVGYNTNGSINTEYVTPDTSMGVGIDANNNIYCASTGGNLLRNNSQIKTGMSGWTMGILIDSSNNVYYASISAGAKVMYSDSNTNVHRTYSDVANSSNGHGISWGPNPNEIYVAFKNGDIFKLTPACNPTKSYSSNGKPPCTPCPTTELLTCPISGTPTCKTKFRVDAETGTKCEKIPCVVGTTFSDDGFETCRPCPANATCTTAMSSGIICNTNFTKSGSGTNTVCNPTPCAFNQKFSSTGKEPCTPCPPQFRQSCPPTGTPTCINLFQYRWRTLHCMSAKYRMP